MSVRGWRCRGRRSSSRWMWHITCPILRTGRHLVARPDNQLHHCGKEKAGCSEYAVDALSLGHEMHEITGDKERFDDRDEQCHSDCQRERGMEANRMHHVAAPFPCGYSKDGTDEQGH